MENTAHPIANVLSAKKLSFRRLAAGWSERLHVVRRLPISKEKGKNRLRCLNRGVRVFLNSEFRADLQVYPEGYM